MKTIKLWNRELVISPNQEKVLQDYILDHIARHEAVGNKVAVSYLKDDVRTYTRLAFPTAYNDAVTMFEALGFTVSRTSTKSGRAGPMYVTL